MLSESFINKNKDNMLSYENALNSPCILLAYSYVPMQTMGKLYGDEEALLAGTVFPELNKPLGVYGKEFCDCK